MAKTPSTFLSEKTSHSENYVEAGRQWILNGKSSFRPREWCQPKDVHIVALYVYILVIWLFYLRLYWPWFFVGGGGVGEGSYRHHTFFSFIYLFFVFVAKKRWESHIKKMCTLCLCAILWVLESHWEDEISVQDLKRIIYILKMYYFSLWCHKMFEKKRFYERWRF